MAPGVITCKMNGIPYNFSRNIRASLVYNAGINLKVSGSLSAISESFQVWIQHPSIKPLTIGSYKVNMGNDFYVLGQYTTTDFNYWIGVSKFPVQAIPFTIVINSFTPDKRVSGTFYGTLREKAGTGPGSKNVTEGFFDVPFN